MRHRIRRLRPHHRLGMERHAHPGQPQHGQIIRPISYSHHLVQINPFTPGNLLKQRRLPSPIHNRSAHRARHQPRRIHVQLIRMHPIHAQPLLQLHAKKGESPG